MTVNMKFEGWDQLQSLFKRFPNEINRTMQATMKGATEIVREGLADAPAPPTDISVHFVSDRQRKWFFAALRDGRIEVPYRRGKSPGSENLTKGWTTQVKGVGATIQGIIGNRASYGPLVQGEQQTAMHRQTGWPTVQQVMRETRDEIQRLFTHSVEQLVNRLAR